MIKSILAVTAAVLLAGAAEAQDYTGNVDPSAYSLPTVMHSAINARARGRSGVRNSGDQEAARARATCANVPRVRARLGADDPRVVRLTRLCRQAGY